MAALLYLCTFLVLQNPFAAQSVALVQRSDSLIARNWTVEDGLPVNAVNSVIQDHRGFLWFTTYDGIVRFDGLNFKVFNHSNTPKLPQNRAVFIHEQEGTGIWVSLENSGVVLFKNDGVHGFNGEEEFFKSDVTTMFEDSKGRMWFGTYEGLYKYEDGTFKRAFTRKKPAQNNILRVYEDQDNSIWTTTQDGLVHLTPDGINVYNIKPGTTYSEFTEMHRSQDGRLLIGSRQGLYVLENGKLQSPASFKPLVGQYVNAIYIDDEVQLISTDRGLYRYDNNRIVKLKSYNSHYSGYQQFYRDSHGLLWILRNNGEAVWLINNKIFPVTSPNSLAQYHFIRIIEDREGNIWLTTARNGIVRVKRTQAKIIGKREGLSGDNILGLFEDSRGRFWVGTRGNGLNVIDGNKITSFQENQQLASDIVHSIAEDKKGNIWVGFYQQGVQKITDNGIKTYDLGFDARINDVHAIYVAKDSTIWLGTYGGLVKFDPENEHHTVYTTNDGLAGNLVRYIDEDHKGGLWIGTADGGISYFKDGSFKNYTMQQGLSSNNIRSVYVDEYDAGTVWVGTENRGLNRIRSNSIAFLGVQEGLPDHIIHYISQDMRGWLWMSSNRGVFKIKKEDLNNYLDDKADYFRIIHYGRDEGMRNPECNGAFQKGGLRTSNDAFWFSTQEGVAIFKIDSQSKNNVPPEVYIQEIFANGEAYSTKYANFEAGINDFQIDFHALTFVNPEKTHFRYKLEGYDKEWTEISNPEDVTYSNIPAGNYTFKVVAANNDGVWSPVGATASIRVNPVFYRRVWFYIALFVLLVIGYYVVSRMRYRYLMKRQANMQHVIDEQTSRLRAEKNEIINKNNIIKEQAKELEESNKAKDKFLSIIGHDLRNPFQALVGYSGILLESHETMSAKEIKQGLQEIDKASERLLNLVKNLLKWSSLQTKKVKPEPEWFFPAELIQKNVQLLTPSADQKEITIRTEIGDEQQLYCDRNMINTVIRNLLSNAIKFTNRGGEIVLKTFCENSACYIRICDNGIGMPQTMIHKLMKVDEQTSRFGTENEAGTGLGLIICKEMVEMNKGKIEIESSEGEGTTFTVILPCSEPEKFA